MDDNQKFTTAARRTRHFLLHVSFPPGWVLKAAVFRVEHAFSRAGLDLQYFMYLKTLPQRLKPTS
ncbi:MAG: hypothetical protein WAM71_01985 [Candidatus Korobacteraceae bacterium]